jgi:hypothetical protein
MCLLCIVCSSGRLTGKFHTDILYRLVLFCSDKTETYILLLQCTCVYLASWEGCRVWLIAVGAKEGDDTYLVVRVFEGPNCP